ANSGVYECSFGGDIAPVLVRVGNAITCTAPARPASNTSLQIIRNGQAFTQPVNFLYFGIIFMVLSIICGFPLHGSEKHHQIARRKSTALRVWHHFWWIPVHGALQPPL